MRFRRGWMLGDGTGAGKARHVAGIILDNWLKDRRALWISKSDKLIEDAQRDWSAIGRERPLVAPLARRWPASARALRSGWRGEHFPFAKRAEFVRAIEAGGVGQGKCWPAILQ